MRVINAARDEALADLAVEPLTLPDPLAAPQPPMLPSFEHWHLIFDQDGVAWAILDCKGQSTNTLSTAVLTEFDLLLDEVTRLLPKGMVIRSAKKNGFVAGAEIGEFKDMIEEVAIRERIGQGLGVLDKLERLPVPTVAVIHGFCLGGGLELVLPCNIRIARSDAKLGFPEVLLGLHPGLGGTWRSVRLIDPVEAMTAMLTGRNWRAKQAKRAGLVDVVTEERHIGDAVRWAFAGKLEKRPPRSLKAKLEEASPMRGAIASRMVTETKKKARPDHYPAPYALIDLWRQYGGDLREMRTAETNSFARLMTSETSRNLVRCFFLRERLKAYAKGTASNIKNVHVVGAGVMGGDIAAWCAIQGFRVSLEDRGLEFIAPAIKRANELFERRIYTEGDRRAANDRLLPDPKGDGLVHADLVIEAVPENPEIKHAVYARCEARLKPSAILATNTSSILLESLRDGLKKPERFCGIHFFNPVAQMPLVEVVTHDGLDPVVKARVLSFVDGIDKLPLPVASAPGFLVNRALTPYMMEAFIAYSEGVKPEVIDAAAEEFGMPMGPIELADTVGLDVGLHVAKVLRRDLARPLPDIPEWFEKLVSDGHLGKKTGRGIYTWKDGKPLKSPVSSQPDAALQDRLILPLLNAVADCLNDKVVENADDADAGVVFGTGFAPFRGGPLHYAEHRGVANVVAALQALQNQYGTRFEPSPGWKLLDPLR